MLAQRFSPDPEPIVAIGELFINWCKLTGKIPSDYEYLLWYLKNLTPTFINAQFQEANWEKAVANIEFIRGWADQYGRRQGKTLLIKVDAFLRRKSKFEKR